MSSIVQLTPEMTKSDIRSLYNGTCSYVVYKPKDKYKNLLGDKCYLVADKNKQKYFNSKGTLALTLDDLSDSVNFKKIVKIIFDGKEIKQCTN